MKTQPDPYALPLRPVPRVVIPFLNEKVSSFVWRIAETHKLHAGELLEFLAESRRNRAPIPERRLAAVSGVPLPVLKYALPELWTPEDQGRLRLAGRPRPGFRDRAGCQRCIGSWRTAGWVRFWARQEDVICHRHWVWTGTKDSLDLSAHPEVASEVIKANRRHRRLIRRHGREAIRSAYYDAGQLCREWNNSAIPNKEIRRRLTSMLGPGWSVYRDEPASEAAYYPNVVELTRILSSPYWRSLILDGHLPASTPRQPWELLGVPADFCWLMESTPGIEQFTREIRRTVNPYFQWNPYSSYRSYAPFTKWVLGELRDRFTPSRYGYPKYQPEVIEQGPLGGFGSNA
ncbi:TniQ family protein [Streptomyces luteireticuli]|uniref:TniQ domain-containing protein n=1 Tax=Streptomyces luteireticuli TaxID=173858 RepID=A0ABP3I2D3_9ACTN